MKLMNKAFSILLVLKEVVYVVSHLRNSGSDNWSHHQGASIATVQKVWICCVSKLWIRVAVHAWGCKTGKTHKTV